MAEDRRTQRNRRKGVDTARRFVEEERRLGERRQGQMWEEAFDPKKNIDLGSDEPASFGEWEKLAEEDMRTSAAAHANPAQPQSRLHQMVFGDEFDDRREAEIRSAKRTIGSDIPEGAQERVLSGVKRDIALQGLNRRVKGYGVAGTLADMAAAYSMAEGTPMERGYEAAKAGLKGAATGVGMQAAINMTGRLGSIAGRGIPIVGAGIGAWNIGKAARGLVDWQSAESEAEQERLGSEAKYSDIGAATTTRHVRDTLRRNSDKNFVQRVLRADDYPVIKNPDGSVSTHLMAAEIDDKTGKNIVFPTIVQGKQGGALKQMALRDAQKYATDTGEYIDFPTLDEAIKFSSDTYKRGTNIDVRRKGWPPDQAATPLDTSFQPLNQRGFNPMEIPLAMGRPPKSAIAVPPEGLVDAWKEF